MAHSPAVGGTSGFEPKTLANWASAGKGPRYTMAIGGRARYHIRDVEAWEETVLAA